MKGEKMKRIVCTVLALAMLASVAALAADEKKPAMTPAQQQAAQEAMMKAVMPGEHHEHMKKLVGEFDYTIKMFIPGQAPQEFTGHRSAKMIMGDRYLDESYTGNFMGMPFEGHGTMAYDNVQKKYLSTWIDNMGTGIMFGSGTCEANGTVWNMTADMADPQTGKMTPTRSVTKLVDADHMTMEMYAPGMDGKEMKMMEISAARSK
jgi:Ni/Co efflux regulator RcnB